jgi:hypothetical protein
VIWVRIPGKGLKPPILEGIQYRGPMASSSVAERMAVNHDVVGSNPTSPASPEVAGWSPVSASRCSSKSVERRALGRVAERLNALALKASGGVIASPGFESQSFLMAVEAEIQNCRKKTRYPNEGSASRAASRIMKMDFTAPNLRPYPCEWCPGWHLTSK